MQYEVQVAKVNSLMFLIYHIEIVAVNNILHWHLTEATSAFIFHPWRLCKPLQAFANEQRQHTCGNCLSLSESFKVMSLLSCWKLFSPFPFTDCMQVS